MENFDKLQLYFREPYIIKATTSEFSNITVTQPTIGDIVQFGEKVFYQTVNVFVTNPTANRLSLWEAGHDWNKLSDYQLFTMLFYTINPCVTSLLFDNIDFSKFVPLKDEKSSDVVFLNPESMVMIDENVYNQISQYMRTIFNIHPKVETTKSKILKEDIIQEETFLKNIKRDEEQSSLLLTLISSCVNHPGFKYKTTELKEVGIYEFMDSVQRLQIYESATATLKGMCSGFVDGSKIKESQYNFMREIK